jgi:prepilin-type N-terminal cleavage/methylation domain-containing protein
MQYEGFVAKTRKGFTLVELAVVIVIIGVLAAFGVPRFLKSVERSKAAEAFAYLAAVRSSQERYQAQNGIYASDITALDIKASTPKYFTVGTVAAGSTSSLQDSWTLTLTRTGASAGYGAYTVIFTQDGYDSTNSGIQALSDINPMGQ